MEHAQSYRIRVEGLLDELYSEHLGGMSISTDLGPNAQPRTTLEGRLRDQAALSGVLNALYEWHFVVISVERL